MIPTEDLPERAAAFAPRNLLVAAVACALGAGIFLYYGQSVIHRWYAAPILMDFGWFNYLINGHDLLLHNPRGMDANSYYSVHVAPMLSVFAGLSRLLHLKGVQPMVLMLGSAFGGAAAMAFLILERFLRPAGSTAAIALGLAGALAYAVSGVMRSTVDYPHMEILYVPFALLTLYLLFQRGGLWVWPALVACLAVREDAGLHLACVLGAYLVLAALEERGRPGRWREIAPVLLVSLGYSATAILWQKTTWPGASTFSQIYSGDPAYAHLTGALMAHRIGLFLGPVVWAPITVLATLAILPFRWRWTALTGIVATLPWLLLNVSARSNAAGELNAYYAFPFLVTVLAPFILAGADPPRPREDRIDVVPL